MNSKNKTVIIIVIVIIILLLSIGTAYYFYSNDSDKSKTNSKIEYSNALSNYSYPVKKKRVLIPGIEPSSRYIIAEIPDVEFDKYSRYETNTSSCLSKRKDDCLEECARNPDCIGVQIKDGKCCQLDSSFKTGFKKPTPNNKNGLISWNNEVYVKRI